MIQKISLILLLGILATSCASRKKLAYYQDIAQLSDSQNVYDPQIKADDLLLIIVSSSVPEAVASFNLTSYGIVGNAGGSNSELAGGQMRHQAYLVDREGNIEFPVLGKIKLGGLSRADALETLRKKLLLYVADPIINLRILNYKITVQGEVARPGTFNIGTERITLPEAISMAGDMTVYGKRTNVLVIREIEGQRTYNFVDITKSDFINSPFYYLTQNDLVYVEPNKTRMNSSAVGPNISVGLSALSLLITVIALLSR